MLRIGCVVRAAFLVLLISISAPVLAESFSGGAPLSPQPDTASMNPGLAVNYHFEYFDHVNELRARGTGREGAPLLVLDHNTIDGDVLSADRPMGVGAIIRGMIHLAEAGTYVFKIQSNDGVRAHVGGIEIWVDPEIHGNRWSRPLEYEVVEPGWYELKIDYYQRKGTSALKLAWTVPGTEEETIVPGTALAH